MHELALAQAIVEIACRHADGRRVARVEVKIGHLRQVVPTALAFSFELVAHGTAAEGAALVLEAVPALGVCRHCGTESVLDAFPLHCGACGAFDLRIVAGEELVVDSLELEEVDGGAHAGEDGDRRGRAERQRQHCTVEPGTTRSGRDPCRQSDELPRLG